MQFVLYFLICLVATTVGAISGVGGGVVIKPVFDAMSGMDVSQISFLSGCTVLAMTIVSLLRSRGEKIELRRGTLLAVGAAVGGLLGKVVFDWVKSLTGSDGLVGVVQSVIMVLLTAGVGVYMFYRAKIPTHNVQNAVLYYFFSMDTKQAALHSIYVIFFSQAASFLSSLAMQNVPAFDPIALAVMVVGGVAGGFVGRALNKKMSVKQVDTLFTVLLAVITLISVYNVVRYASLL